MLALEGYYDGENIQALEEIHAQKNQKLIITILDEFVEEVPKAKSTKTVRGMLAKYADQSLREQEKSAWEKPVLDANIILRYLLNDNEKMASEAEAIIKNMPVQVNIEIVAEVIYVLKGVYHVGRAEIRQCLLQFLSDVYGTLFGCKLDTET